MGLTTGQDLSGANQNLQAANFGRPDMVSVTPDTQPTFAPAPPSANGDAQAPVMTSPGLPKLLLSGSPQQTTDIQNLQKAKLPFFSAIAQGGANISNPNLTKGGKLLTLMMSGLKGALDGSGGRTFGEGYQRAEMLPIEKNKAQLENQLTGAQVQNIPFQRAILGAKYQQDLADTTAKKFVTPRSGGVYNTETQTWEPGTQPVVKPENIDQMIADASGKAIAAGRDPNQDPTVQKLSDVKTGLTNPKADNPFTAWQKENPNSPVSDYLTLQKQRPQTVNVNANNARADKSYQYNNTQLTKLGDPIEALSGRISRLQDSIAQNSPQADALIAPELLTIMAGGQGSGLRMNEAEISRIVGGRSNWQSLQAAANKWRLDPNTANSITPDQRQQIRNLIQTVADKVTKKRAIIEQANQSLIGTDDVTQHRTILANARKKLADIDAGQQQPTTPTPAPATHVFSKSAWLKANPNGDVNAAVKAATAQNFTVTD